MQFYFIRHAQSSNNLLWDTTGSSNGRSHDPELTEIGLRQAHHLARFLAHSPEPPGANGSSSQPPKRDYYNAAGFGITHLYSSLMLRAVMTGTKIARELGLPLVAWEDLHEFGGIYLDDERTGEPVGQPGSNRAFFEEHYPGLVLPPGRGTNGWWNRPHESHAEGLLRVRRFFHDLLERHGSTQDRVAVVSHGEFYNMLLRLIFKIEGENCWFDINNTGITRIDFDARGIDLVYANRVDFLPPGLVT